MNNQFIIKNNSSNKIAGKLFLGSFNMMTDTYSYQFVLDSQVNIDLDSPELSIQPEKSITKNSRDDSGCFVGTSKYIEKMKNKRNFSGGVSTYDFSSDAGQAYGGASAQYNLGSSGIWGMMSGHLNGDGNVTITRGHLYRNNGLYSKKIIHIQVSTKTYFK